MTLVARYGALSDIGLHRKTNEDTFVARPPLFAVCDGMGGAQAGEVASGLAAETLAAAVADGRPLLEAAETANAAVHTRASASDAHAGMGTTLTACLLEGDTGHFVHIGDSRAYLLRDGILQQVSDDHSLVGEMVRDGRLTEAEAAVHPHRSILSRALGTEPTARIDEFAVDLRAGDAVLLCSDGLSGPVPADAIRAALAKRDPQAAAERLIKEARRHGGPDNITAVVIRLVSPDDTVSEEPAASEDDETTEVTAELPALGDPADGAGADAAVAYAAAGGDAADALAAARRSDASDALFGTAVVPPAPPSAAPAADAHRRRRSHRRLGIIAGLLAGVAILGAAGVVVLSTVYFIGVDDGRLAIYSGLPAQVGPVRLHAVYRRSVRTYDSLTPAERRIVDAQALHGRAEAMDVSRQLEMWP